LNRLQLAIDQIVFVRNYTIGLLDQTFAAPAKPPSKGPMMGTHGQQLSAV
jgi:hypothetical protein